MSQELSPMRVQYTGQVIQAETCDHLGGSSGDVVRNYT